MRHKWINRCALFITCLLVQLRPIRTVRGCLIYVIGTDYSMRQAICDKLDTHFARIPPTLPGQVVNLTVNHQNLTRLGPRQFGHLPNLTYLNLDLNQIEQIDVNTFSSLKRLQTLSLRFNQLQFTTDSFHPSAMSGLDSLLNFNLMYNPIGRVGREILKPISRHLQSLVLSWASIDGLILLPGAFNDLHNLRLLDLTYNHLTSLSSIFQPAFDQMQLTEFYIHGNPWHCDCRLKWLRAWLVNRSGRLIFYRKEIDSTEPSVDWTSLTNDQTTTTNYFQPRCASPQPLARRALVDGPSMVASISQQELVCPPESLTRSEELIKARLGTNYTLSCTLLADPRGKVSWYHQGARIADQWPKVQIVEGRGQEFTTKLILSNLDHSDSGKYACYLETELGRANSTFVLQVEDNVGSGSVNLLSSISNWFRQLDSAQSLKLTGIVAACAVITLSCIGLLVYCFCWPSFCRSSSCLRDGQNNNKSKSSCNNNNTTSNDDPKQPIDKSSTDAMAPLKGQLLAVEVPNSQQSDLVAFQLLPTNPANNTTDHQPNGQLIRPDCPVHQQYTLLSNLGSTTSPLLLSPQHQALLSDQSLVLNHTHSASPSSSIYTPQLSRASASDSNDIKEESTSMLNQCPLHGAIYAEALIQHNQPPVGRQTPSQLDESKQHIATIPPGLGSIGRAGGASKSIGNYYTSKTLAPTRSSRKTNNNNISVWRPAIHRTGEIGTDPSQHQVVTSKASESCW